MLPTGQLKQDVDEAKLLVRLGHCTHSAAVSAVVALLPPAAV